MYIIYKYKISWRNYGYYSKRITIFFAYSAHYLHSRQRRYCTVFYKSFSAWQSEKEKKRDPDTKITMHEGEPYVTSFYFVHS